MPRKKIAVFTGTRAEYGLLHPLLLRIRDDPPLELQLIVSGMHLSPDFGYTVSEIERDGFEPAAKVDMLLSSDRPVGVGKSLGLGVLGLTDALDRLNPDCVVILGDRFEALAMAQAAVVMKTPIIHLHGGEITEGAFDDSIRHSITKFSSLHFTSTAEYKQRVIQMGELPYRVLNVGSLAVENIKESPLLEGSALNQALNFQLHKNNILVTYHPVTMDEVESREGLASMLAALEEIDDCSIVITFPNADSYGREVAYSLKKFAEQHSTKVLLTESLGRIRYLSTMKSSKVVLGNSSSGLIEAPILGIPTINIGSRQKGRFAPQSVIQCDSNKNDIKKNLLSILSGKSPHRPSTDYGDGTTSKKIVEVIKSTEFTTLLPKTFFDIPFKLNNVS